MRIARMAPFGFIVAIGPLWALAGDQFATDRENNPNPGIRQAQGKEPIDPKKLEPLKFDPKKVDPKILKDFNIKLDDEIPAGPSAAPKIYGSAPSAGTNPLTLPEVLKSVDDHYPALRFAELERAVAGGRLLSSMGAFDTNLSATGRNAPLATFENYTAGFGVNQAFSTTGLRAFATNRYGYGDFPGYSGASKTADGGEWAAGISYPFLRDGSIDRARANLQQAEINRQAVEPFIDRQRLTFHRAAARVYWTWVALGERLRVVRYQINLARERDAQFKKLVDLLQLSPLDRADNQQNLQLRYGREVETQAAFLQASSDLSLFLRDQSGKPVIATFDRLPEFPDMLVPDANKMDEAIQLAFNLRPEIKRLRFQQQTLEVELAWARNQQLPALNAILAARSDVGLGKPAVGPSRLDRNSLEVGFEFQVPWQRREAIGRAMAAQAQIVQIAQQLRQQEDEIRIEVQAGLSTLERSYQNFVVAEKRAKLALDVAEGERRLFDLGLATIITVNLREQNAFDAQLELVGAKLNYFRLLADYKAALGIFDR